MQSFTSKHWTRCVCLCNRLVRIALERVLLQKFLLYSKHVHDLKNREQIKTKSNNTTKMHEMQSKICTQQNKMHKLQFQTQKKLAAFYLRAKKNCTFECCDFCQFFVIFLAFFFRLLFMPNLNFDLRSLKKMAIIQM